ncbi:voltage-gated chloride channel family protein [Sediminibacterium ginsengisoli]|uniref:H+/Cl-antiporter ClcA n=1 Tax=Sediminibacterium ginsengisoli TaxID=413434 RepID=A0A1T4K8T3_9BACT|nr:voltage-gated chloride channel family protein [Sediminibacterium ginsengisoli]SJZ38806.1 H+/Cl-antiporter ClcA [Sediminibacterium ginsengisoli]
MKQIKTIIPGFSTLKHAAQWLCYLLVLAILSGSMVALFLWLLELATEFRWQHEWLLFLLPVAGVLIYLLYRFKGKRSEKGNDLVIDEIHEPGGGIPVGMTPLILFSTIVTHLFGGSAGREGTAVQMGGSLAALTGKWFRLPANKAGTLLMAGIAAGFGAVFGTPVAGAVFALEVLTVGKLRYQAFIPCIIAALLADLVCNAWGISHVQYRNYLSEDLNADVLLRFNWLLFLKVLLGGILFGLAARLFATGLHTFKKMVSKLPVRAGWLVPFAGGCIIIGLSYWLQTSDYLGLGVSSKTEAGTSIISAFRQNGATDWSWFWKILFTVITLGTGFKGGEVTPLFFIGATLGNTIAAHTGAPADLFAALGFIAVFAGATNTPIACTLLGIELFGPAYALYFTVACFAAYYSSGHKGIYKSQRVPVSKFDKWRRTTDG